jgi:hypothetical protein
MLLHVSRSPGLAALVGTLIATSGLVLADDKPSSTQEGKDSNQGKTSGMILKVEPVGPGDQARKRSWRVTINTDVVWRDFVRDQAVDPAKAARTGTAKAAAKGKKSVATEGHPRGQQMLVTVNLDPETEITMRYRSSTDAISEGAPTAEGASKAEDATDNSSKTKTAGTPARPGSRRQPLKPRVLEPMELKPGLWIEVEFRRSDKGNRARRVMVMRPVGGPDTSPEKEKASSSRRATPGR